MLPNVPGEHPGLVLWPAELHLPPSCFGEMPPPERPVPPSCFASKLLCLPCCLTSQRTI